PGGRGAGRSAERELGAPPPAQARRRALRALARGTLPGAPRPRPRPHPRHAWRAPQRLDLRPPSARAGRVCEPDRGAVRGRGEEARARPAPAAALDRSVPPAGARWRAADVAVATRPPRAQTLVGLSASGVQGRACPLSPSA